MDTSGAAQPTGDVRERDRRGLASWVLQLLSGLWNRSWLRWSAVLLSLVLLLLTGIVGLGRSEGFMAGGFDFDFFHNAGLCWWSGISPYDTSAFSKASPELIAFAYPPSISALAMGLGLFPHNVAWRIMQVLNLLALACVMGGLLMLAEDERGSDFKSRLGPVLALLVLSSPFCSHVIWMGQSSLLAIGTIIAAFVAAARQRWILAGVLSALAMFKPQMALLAVLFMSLKGNHRYLLALVLTSVALFAWPLWVSGGPSHFLAEYQASLAAYQAGPSVAISFPHVFGLRSLLHSLGLPSPSLAPAVLPIAALLVWRRRSLSPVEVLAINSLAALLFLPSHDYDLVLLAPLIPVAYAAAGRYPAIGLASLAGVLLLSFPQRVLRPFGSQVLLRYRELICLAGLVALVFWVWPRRPLAPVDPCRD